jgi:hypothetical protein
MKKIFGLLILLVALVSMVQAQQIAMSAAMPVEVRSFKIDTVKTASADSSTIFYVPYSMNVIGIVAISPAMDSSSNVGTKPGIAISLYPFNPTTGIAGASICSAKLYTSNIENTGTPATSTAGKLTRGGYYKVSVTVPTGGHAYLTRVEVHYTR